MDEKVLLEGQRRYSTRREKYRALNVDVEIHEVVGDPDLKVSEVKTKVINNPTRKKIKPRKIKKRIVKKDKVAFALDLK